MLAGQPLSHMVELVGVADDDVAWELTDGNGLQVASGTVTPEFESLLVLINIAGEYNMLPPGAMLGDRTLSWTYQVDGAHRGNSFSYRLQGQIPFAVSPRGVRTRLGLSDAEDLEDEDVPLLKAYLEFSAKVSLGVVTDDLTNLRVCAAIEAMAALAVLPTLQVRVAKSESSGTNQYTRDRVDWSALEAALQQTVLEGELAVNPNLASTSSESLLVLVTPDTNLFPGA